MRLDALRSVNRNTVNTAESHGPKHKKVDYQVHPGLPKR